jgi:hypothetical protein
LPQTRMMLGSNFPTASSVANPPAPLQEEGEFSTGASPALRGGIATDNFQTIRLCKGIIETRKRSTSYRSSLEDYISQRCWRGASVSSFMAITTRDSLTIR